MDTEMKNIIDEIISGFTRILKLDVFTNKISQFLDRKYLQGMEKAEKTFNMNFIPSDRDTAFLKDYVSKNIDDVADDVGKQLRQEISRGLLSGDNVEELEDRIKETFNDSKFSNRLKTVLRTESVRAENKGSIEGARQAGIKLKKYLIVTLDGRTSNICRREHRQYGSKDKAIPLDEKFEVTLDDGKVVKMDAPPFHVNCRTTLGYVQEDPDE